jgi:hypothetical protein
MKKLLLTLALLSTLTFASVKDTAKQVTKKDTAKVTKVHKAKKVKKVKKTKKVDTSKVKADTAKSSVKK